MDNNEKIIVGKINGFYGLKGFVKVFSETRPRDAIFDYDHLFIFRNNEWQKLGVESTTYAGKSLAIKFKGFSDRTAIESYHGQELFIDASQLETLPEGEFYWAELLNSDVKNELGHNFGKVKEFLETGANDVMIVKNDEGIETLIPFTIDHAILNVDKENKMILVDWEPDDL